MAEHVFFEIFVDFFKLEIKKHFTMFYMSQL